MRQVNKTSEVALPPSAIDGIFWPAIPSPDINSTLSLAHQLELSQWWAPEVLAAFQLRQIEKLLGHAWRTVPYYRAPLDEVVKIPAGRLRMDDFRNIPLLRKADLQAHKNDLQSKGLPKSHLPIFKIATSGSTGTPVTLLGTGVSGRFNGALSIRWHTWHKRTPNDKLAEILFPDTAETKDSPKQRRWGVGFVSGPMVTSGANQPIESQIEWLWLKTRTIL